MSPPGFAEALARALKKEDSLERVIRLKTGAAPQGKYRHWDTLRHVPPPDGVTSEEWWLAIKVARRALFVSLPLRDRHGIPFQYAVPNVAQQMLMQVDRDATGRIQAAEPVTDAQARDTYLLRSVMEEAITSSQLEGASTTREVAKEMIQRGRRPETRDERMIFNNYQALTFIRDRKDEPLTPATVLELHRVLTEGTLDDEDAAGRLRSEAEAVHVVDEVGNVLHLPPPAAELPQRLAAICAFANGEGTDGFMHPVVRAVILHFALAYDHPFVDGNGRAARALCYWSMARDGYWMSEYISISRILRRAPGRYTRSFLYTETDENDVTYFLLSQLRVILRAIQELHQYLAAKEAEQRETRDLIHTSAVLRQQMNGRQLGLVRHALKHPGFRYTIESHRATNNVSYATARSDLLRLAEFGLLESAKGAGKLMLFVSPADLKERLARVA
jgi:Fic family protein